jgi:hypothetical protein
MRTRKKGIKKHKKYRTCFKIYRGGRSSSSNKSSDKGSDRLQEVLRVSSAGPANAASSPKRVASSPKKVASSPKRVASSPKKVASSPKFSTGVVPVDKLKGRGRDRDLPYKANIHSEDDSLPDDIIEGLKSKAREKMERNRKKLERRIRASTPPPPPVELSPRGRNLLTTYTPELDIVDIGIRTPVHGRVTTTGYIMKPFEYNYHRLLPLSYLTKREVEQKTKENAKMLVLIELFPKTYIYLSPIICHTLMGINRLDLYGKVLVLGALRDELIPNISLTSVEVMESRFFTSRDETIQIMKNIEQIVKSRDLTGPTPANLYGTDIPDIDVISPITEPISPTSFQLIGYNKHPMFRTQPMSRDEEMELVKLSEKHEKIGAEDFAFVVAHGAIVNELSPEIKLLANKYLRIIELGKAGQVISFDYNSIVFEINNILRNPSYNAMFDNTDEGELMRKSAFSVLCPYISSDKIKLCDLDDTFYLVDITHDREFSGHVVDSKIKDNQKVTYKSFKNLLSMGIFLPVNYTTDKSTPYTAKKELFKLYPGTTFLSTTTNMKLVETLLPIAIKENRRINLIIMSCGVSYTVGDAIYDDHAETKPGINNPAIELLTGSKKYLSKLNNLIDKYVLDFYSDGVVNLLHKTINGAITFMGYRDYAKDGKIDILFTIAQHVNNFYTSKFKLFSQFLYSDLGKVEENFSFAGLNTYHQSNDLVSSRNPYKFAWYSSYIDEIIKVKIFLMHEFKKVLSLRIVMVRTSLDIIVQNLTELRARYGPGPFPSDVVMQNTCDMLDEAIQGATIMNEYFRRLEGVVIYINNGLTPPNDPNSFLDYKKYREIKKEYDEGPAKEFYEKLVENLDYDRFEGENVGFNERLYKTKLLNPLTSGPFRKTQRFMYRYSTLPGYDQIKDRRKTMKKQLYDKMKIGKHARKAKKSSDVSV